MQFLSCLGSGKMMFIFADDSIYSSLISWIEKEPHHFGKINGSFIALFLCWLVFIKYIVCIFLINLPVSQSYYFPCLPVRS